MPCEFAVDFHRFDTRCQWAGTDTAALESCSLKDVSTGLLSSFSVIMLTAPFASPCHRMIPNTLSTVHGALLSCSANVELMRLTCTSACNDLAEGRRCQGEIRRLFARTFLHLSNEYRRPFLFQDESGYVVQNWCHAVECFVVLTRGRYPLPPSHNFRNHS